VSEKKRGKWSGLSRRRKGEVRNDPQRASAPSVSGTWRRSWPPRISQFTARFDRSFRRNASFTNLPRHCEQTSAHFPVVEPFGSEIQRDLRFAVKISDEALHFGRPSDRTPLCPSSRQDHLFLAAKFNPYVRMCPVPMDFQVASAPRIAWNGNLRINLSYLEAPREQSARDVLRQYTRATSTPRILGASLPRVAIETRCERTGTRSALFSYLNSECDGYEQGICVQDPISTPRTTSDKSETKPSGYTRA
jgi:hypothetical protein